MEKKRRHKKKQVWAQRGSDGVEERGWGGSKTERQDASSLNMYS